MPAFHDIRFPDHISYGSSGGPAFSTTVMALTSGFERRNINWSQVRASYEAVHGIKSREDMEVIIAFFFARMGKAYSFRFKDWADFETGYQELGEGDGTKTAFQIIKKYESGGYAYTRLITKPTHVNEDGDEEDTLTNVTVDGVLQTLTADYVVNYNTGIITFNTAPGAGKVVAIGNTEFDVHCRFDTDQLAITHDFWETMSWPSIPLVEIKEFV